MNDDGLEVLAGVWFVAKVAAALVIGAAFLGVVLQVFLWAAGLGC